MCDSSVAESSVVVGAGRLAALLALRPLKNWPIMAGAGGQLARATGALRGGRPWLSAAVDEGGARSVEGGGPATHAGRRARGGGFRFSSTGAVAVCTRASEGEAVDA